MRQLWVVAMGPDVRHKPWTEGREAAFGSYARWRAYTSLALCRNPQD